jgi:hypothetical protein
LVLGFQKRVDPSNSGLSLKENIKSLLNNGKAFDKPVYQTGRLRLTGNIGSVIINKQDFNPSMNSLERKFKRAGFDELILTGVVNIYHT